MSAVTTEQAAQRDLGLELGMTRIGDVVMAQIAVQLVGEEPVAIVEREEHLGDQAGDGERGSETSSMWIREERKPGTISVSRCSCEWQADEHAFQPK